MNSSNTPLGSPDIEPDFEWPPASAWLIFIFFLLGLWKFVELALELIYSF